MTGKFRVLALTGIGSSLEFYDFIISILFAQQLTSLFVHAESKYAGYMIFFVMLAISYLIRPVGGMIFGHIGDRRGRKFAFTLTLLIMGGSSLLTAVLPTYQSIGILASILFFVFRFVQSLAIGGETGGTITFVFEKMPDNVGLACGWIFGMINLGVLFASMAVVILDHTLTQSQLQSYGWRILYLIGVVVAIAGYTIRIKLSETPEFLALREHKKAPLLTALRNYPSQLIQAFGIAIFASTIGMAFYITIGDYVQMVAHYSASTASYLVFTANIVSTIGIFLYALLADRVGVKKLFWSAFIMLIPASFLFYRAINASEISVYLSVSVIALIAAVITCSHTALMIKLFPTSIRYSSFAVSYNLAYGIFGGSFAAIMMALYHSTKNIYAPAYIILFVACCSLMCIFIFPKMVNAKAPSPQINQ